MSSEDTRPGIPAPLDDGQCGSLWDALHEDGPVADAAGPVPDDSGQGLPSAHGHAQGCTGAVTDEAAMLSAAFRADLASLREHVTAALDRSTGRCARCKVCDVQVGAVMAAVGAEFDRLHAALEHAESAAAGSHEGIRLWMLDCGQLVAWHRDRAARAEARLAAGRKRYRDAVASVKALKGGSGGAAHSASCTGCGERFADSETSEYEFATRERMERLLHADGWTTGPVLCGACQPDGSVP